MANDDQGHHLPLQKRAYLILGPFTVVDQSQGSDHFGNSCRIQNRCRGRSNPLDAKRWRFNDH